jgi:hypothetical protein
MPSSHMFTLFATLSVLATLVATARSQDMHSTSHGDAPRFLNIVREQIKPGRSSANNALETEIVSDFTRADIGAYWLEAERSGEEILGLNFLNSFEEVEKVVASLSTGYARHPEIVAKVDRKLQENVSVINTVFTVRRNDLGYRAEAVDFSKARILWLTTFQVRPGHADEFAEAVQLASAAYEKQNAATPWVVYEVNDGLPAPAFVLLMPLRSLKELGEAIATRQRIETGEASGARTQEIVRNAYASVKTDIFYINPTCSHMPKEFTRGDPDFWTPKPVPADKTR